MSDEDLLARGLRETVSFGWKLWKIRLEFVIVSVVFKIYGNVS